MHAALENRNSEIYQHLIAGDEDACRRYIDQIVTEDAVSVLGVCEQLTEACHSIGDGWACSEISVYREHVASQIGYRLLLDLSSSLPAVSETAPTAIGCTPESDPYSLPTLMVELVMRELGWNARSLGTTLPLELLAPAMEDSRPSLCWVSVSYVESPDRLRQQLEFLGEEGRTDGIRILCGGQAITEELRQGISDITFVGDLCELETIAQTS